MFLPLRDKERTKIVTQLILNKEEAKLNTLYFQVSAAFVWFIRKLTPHLPSRYTV